MMVRIRSDRWYSGENQKKIRRAAPSSTAATRRVVSLVFLLALVMLLMHKAKNPQTISHAFRSLGMPLDQPVIDATYPELKSMGATNSDANSRQHRQEDIAPATDESEADQAWIATCRDLLHQCLDMASVDQVEHLALLLFSEQGSTSPNVGPTLGELDIGPILQPLQSRLDPSQENDQLWNDRLLRFQNQWQLLTSLSVVESNQTIQVKELDPQFRKTLAEELDQRLMGALRDASPWTGSESVGFGRLLQRSRDFATRRNQVRQVSTRQLDTEFLKLRGDWVKFRGVVRLVETVRRPQPLLDRPVYYVLWLRGQDQSTQPIAVYTAQPIAEKFARQLQAEQFPEVELIGLVGKKLAYSSAAGVQVTPTLFADAIVQFASSQAQVQPVKSDLTSTQWLLGSAVVTLGALFFVITVWRQLRKSKRVRSSTSTMMWACVIVPSLYTQSLACPPQVQPKSATESQPSTEDPPWRRKSDKSAQLKQIIEQRLQPLFTPELLAQLALVIEGQSTAAPDLMLRSIYSIKQAGWTQMWESGKAIKLHEQFNLKPMELEGTVRNVQALNLSDFQQDWFSVQPIGCIYQLKVELPSDDQQQSGREGLNPDEKRYQSTMATIFCVNVPSIWKSSAQLRQPVRIKGYELSREKTAETGDAGNQYGPQNLSDSAWRKGVICYIANQVEWRVDSVSEDSLPQLLPRLPEAWSQLGRQGWDLAWFDLLAENNKRAVSAEEADALRSMLSITASEASVSLLSPSGRPSVQLMDTLGDSTGCLGEKIDWTVRLVSATQVDLDDKLRYFQFDGFARLPPGREIKFDAGTGDGRVIDFKGEFPVTVLTMTRPEVLSSRQAKAVSHGGWTIGMQVQVQGRFFRLWSYESERVKTSTGTGRLIAPLVMASSILEKGNPPVMNRSGLWWLYLVAILLVVVISSLIQIRFRGRSRRARLG